MPDDFGRVNLLPHILDRGARQEPYHGRNGRKHHQPDTEGDSVEIAEKETPESAIGTHVDFRI